MLPSTAERVPLNTIAEVNRRIRDATETRIVHFASHPEIIDARLVELDREWDIERVLETNASVLALAGTALGATVSKRFLILPVLITAFLFQHALQGWCPPIPVLRRMGYRTAREIDIERVALKILRGDFGPLLPANGNGEERAKRALEIARA